jgi:hypothetical protein
METRNQNTNGEEEDASDLLFPKPGSLGAFGAFGDLTSDFEKNHHTFDFNFDLMAPAGVPSEVIIDPNQNPNEGTNTLINSSNLLINSFLFSNQLVNASGEHSSNNGSRSPSLSDSDLLRHTAGKSFNDLVSMPASSVTASSSTSSPISQDDLVDKRDVLKQIYKEFFVKNECIADANTNTFITKSTKLTKSMQRKLFHLHQTVNLAAIYANEPVVEKFTDSSAINFAELTTTESEELVTRVMQVNLFIFIF